MGSAIIGFEILDVVGFTLDGNVCFILLDVVTDDVITGCGKLLFVNDGAFDVDGSILRYFKCSKNIHVCQDKITFLVFYKLVI